MKKISLLLAEDHMILREGLRKILEIEADFHVVGEAQDGREAVTLAQKFCPAVILMDISMPLLNGLEATRQIIKLLPATRVLMLSSHYEDAYITNAIESGVAGYLLKQNSSREVAQAIRDVYQGKTFFSPSLAKRIDDLHGQSFDRTGNIKKHVVSLTSREMEVLQLIAEGKANKETAIQLGIGIKTVEKHREHLMKKLDIHDTAGLTRYAMSIGVIESGTPLTSL